MASADTGEATIQMSAHQAQYLSETIQQLQERLNRVESQQDPSLTSPAEPPEVIPKTSNQPRGPKVSVPDVYHGSREKLQDFFSQLGLYFALRGYEFPSDIVKILFAGSFLRGNASTWFQALAIKQDNGQIVPELQHWTLFRKALQDNFGEIDRKDHVKRLLFRLRQTKSAADYAAQFQRLAAELDWPDGPLCTMYLEGLKENVRGELRVRESEIPEDLQTLIRVSVKLDNHLFERQRGERPNRSFSTFQERIPQGTRSTMTTYSTPMPMDLDGTEINSRRPRKQNTIASSTVAPESSISQVAATNPRRGKLTPQEREDRIKNDLCLYCGKPGHKVADCRASARNKQQLAAVAVPSDDSIPGPATHQHLVVYAQLDEPQARLKTMIDSGATSNFIHQDLVNRLDIPMIEKPQPLPLDVIDGTPISSGKITHHTAPLVIRVSPDHTETLTFNIIPLGKYDVVLGSPWLSRHNPKIDWTNRSIRFDSSNCQKACLRPTATGRVDLLSAQTFAATLDSDTVTTGVITLSATSDLPSVELPVELKEFQPLFEEQAAKRLPPHQPWDHEIPLQEGKQPPYGPIYSLSETELTTLREYIAENLETGFI